MKHTKLKATAALALCGALLVAGAGAAQAEPTPQTKDVVGVGSDTTQIAVTNAFDGYKAGPITRSGYNGQASARVWSFDATDVAGLKGGKIAIRPGVTITRPDGSGAGKALLYGTANNTSVDFARSSSGLTSAEVGGNLAAYPFALDQVAGAVKGGSTYAPGALSIQQLVKIYDGTFTNWSQVGGANAPMTVLLPQDGSGTRSFFLGQLKAANGNVDVVIASSVIQTVQEHDETVFTTYSNAVAPFSVGRAALANASGAVVALTNTGTASDGNAAFNAKRAVYNVVRGGETKAFVADLFGTSGYLCSSNARAAISAGGLAQLATPANGGVCGQRYTTTTGVSNFATS